MVNIDNEFDVYSEITLGQELSGEDLCAIFKCGPQGGMRKSNKTNSLVLVSDQTQSRDKNPYQDRREDGVLHYTGMGLKGDQNINFMQNKTLANLEKNKVKAFLFEKLTHKKYTFRGEVVLAGEVYTEIQEDSKGNKRSVLKFPLKIIENTKK